MKSTSLKKNQNQIKKKLPNRIKNKLKIFLLKNLNNLNNKQFIYKKIKSLTFILNRIKFRLLKKKIYLKFKKKNLKNFHNKNLYLNFYNLKDFLITSKNLEVNQDTDASQKFDVFFDREFLKKKQLFLKKKNLKKNFFTIKTLYNSFLFCVFKNGKKTQWNFFLNNLFELMSFSLAYSIPIIISKIFIRLFTRVELKKAISRKRISYIPTFIKINRSIFLALKWIFLGALKNTNRTTLRNKLYVELVQLLTNKTCFSLQKLEENNINSFKNRSNMHFRWQRTR